MHVCMMHISMILDPDTCMYLCSLILDSCMYDARMVHASMMRNFSVTEGRTDEQGDSRSRIQIIIWVVLDSHSRPFPQLTQLEDTEQGSSSSAQESNPIPVMVRIVYK